MGLINRAQILADRIDKYRNNLPIMSLSSYLMFMGIVFFISGLMLFIYCVWFKISIFRTDVISCPLFYLVEGFVLFFLYFLSRTGKYPFNK